MTCMTELLVAKPVAEGAVELHCKDNVTYVPQMGRSYVSFAGAEKMIGRVAMS
jgi:hypothetical protein